MSDLIDHTGDPDWILTTQGWRLLTALRKEVIKHDRPRGGRATWTEYYDDCGAVPLLVRRDVLTQPGKAILTGGPIA